MVSLLILMAFGVASGQSGSVATPTPTPAPASEPEDPWDRWVQEYYRVVTVPKGTELRLGGNLARPHPRVNAVMEIVAEDDEFVYLRNLPLEDPRSAGHRAWQLRQGRDIQQQIREEAFKGKYIITEAGPPLPPRFTQRLKLQPVWQGLPTEGLWQMGFAMADFNRDGLADLLLPPARKGEPHPWIFLQREDHSWTPWADAQWAEGPAYDYGDVEVADFDGDGNLDIAIACHFKPSYVLYGDGKGGFSRWVELPRANKAVTSRALAVADFNKDGRPDIVLLAELDIDLGTSQAITSGLVNVVLNTPKGWEVSPATFPRNIYGDQVAVGDFDGNGLPDILTASHKAGNPFFVFLNENKGQSFKPYQSDAFPIQSFVLGVASGSLDGKAPDQVVLAVYQSLRPQEGLHHYSHALLAYRLAEKPGKLLPQPKRTVIYVDQEEPINSFRAVNVGDLDRDGRTDVVALRANGQLLILLQQPDGGFALEKQELGIKDASPSSVMVQPSSRGVFLVANFSDNGPAKGGVRVWEVRR
ncbi:MAG: VCBS repeat-containing protein [Thermoanaerobaculum sp.]|nr:VCBS repeat-containing protein [Thermoanaerobaculum sp.]